MEKGQEEGKLTLTVLNGNVYATIGDPATATVQQICNSGVSITGLKCATNITVDNGEGFTNATLSFNTSGTVRDIGDSTTYNKFILRRGNRRFEVMVYPDTGSVETKIF